MAISPIKSKGDIEDGNNADVSANPELTPEPIEDEIDRKAHRNYINLRRLIKERMAALDESERLGLKPEPGGFEERVDTQMENI